MKTHSLKSIYAAATLVAALGLVSLNSGCLAVAVGAGAAGTVAWVRGELKGTISASFARTEEAANAAVRDLQFAKISEQHDALLAIIIARTAGDKKVEIRIENTATDVSTVKIRVGVVGDEALSITILDKIKSHL